MSGTIKRIAGPAYLAASATNVYTPPASTMGIVITHIHLFNDDSVARTFSLYVGGTGGSTGGTQLFKDMPIAAKTPYDYFCEMDMASTDFLVGLADSASKVVITVEGEQYVK